MGVFPQIPQTINKISISQCHNVQLTEIKIVIIIIIIIR